MTGEDQHDPSSRDDDEGGGLVDSDDTTQADAGLAGGTGASPGESTVQPLGTEPHDGEGEGEAAGDRG